MRRRFKAARDLIGMRPLRWHDLRHTFGSLLVAGGADLVSVKRPAGERAATFTAAFASAVPGAPRRPAGTRA